MICLKFNVDSDLRKVAQGTDFPFYTPWVHERTWSYSQGVTTCDAPGPASRTQIIQGVLDRTDTKSVRNIRRATSLTQGFLARLIIFPGPVDQALIITSVHGNDPAFFSAKRGHWVNFSISTNCVSYPCGYSVLRHRYGAPKPENPVFSRLPPTADMPPLSNGDPMYFHPSNRGRSRPSSVA